MATDWSWESDPTWEALKTQLAGISEDVTILELCAGAGTLLISLKKIIGERAHSVGQWDWNNEVRPLLESLHDRLDIEKVHTGPTANITEIAPEFFPEAHCIVAGPPCPPWSSIGSRKSFKDDRSKVFVAVMNVFLDRPVKVSYCFCFGERQWNEKKDRQNVIYHPGQ